MLAQLHNLLLHSSSRVYPYPAGMSLIVALHCLYFTLRHLRPTRLICRHMFQHILRSSNILIKTHLGWVTCLLQSEGRLLNTTALSPKTAHDYVVHKYDTATIFKHCLTQIFSNHLQFFLPHYYTAPIKIGNLAAWAQRQCPQYVAGAAVLHLLRNQATSQHHAIQLCVSAVQCGSLCQSVT